MAKVYLEEKERDNIITFLNNAGIIFNKDFAPLTIDPDSDESIEEQQEAILLDTQDRIDRIVKDGRAEEID